MLSDELLIEGLKKGDESSYKYLYEYHYQILCIIASEYTQDVFTAETIVSDVIFRIWQKRDSLEITQSLRGYLIKAVRNSCLNYLDQTSRQEELKNRLQQIEDIKQANVENQSDNPFTKLIEKELDLKIENSLKALPPLTRQIFEMSRFQNMKYDEIATKIGLSVNAVKYHIKSALAYLRVVLKDYIMILFIYFSLF
ncbi:RNA polymerase sigma-70 factor [Parabacteroides sp. AF48-14]|uniref:RNA polymerase sigma-70 factor n=1 Tax=Parabacteroides sp. AF48-14 TaxID=2292052 RepID=UPI000EFF232F|nr:RNA polymerase sigma-70 factor [Parabacteroides sp. AF48-14]RHO69980.1 RNA polymerase sigma-70 factor [Parabacteroides sp. AF48-14]